MVHYKPVKITLDTPGLTKIIINVVLHHHGLLDSIVTYKSFFFTSKFWSSICYFFGIKQRLFTKFYPQIYSQAE